MRDQREGQAVKPTTVRSVLITSLVLVLAVWFWRMSSGANPEPVVRWGWLQDHRHIFYVTKALTALGSILVLLLHMNQIWGRPISVDQRLRYLTLFYFGTLITVASTQQAQARHEQLIHWWNLGAFGGIVLLLVTGILSIRAAGGLNYSRVR